MPYIVTFTINTPQMLAYIAYGSVMGIVSIDINPIHQLSEIGLLFTNLELERERAN